MYYYLFDWQIVLYNNLQEKTKKLKSKKAAIGSLFKYGIKFYFQPPSSDL